MSQRFETLQIHGGFEDGDPTSNATAVPIYQTTAYRFDSAEHAAKLFGLQEFGNIYSRIMNPTNDALEKRLAALEGGVMAVATASGHSAEFAAIANLAQAGDNIVASPHLYGGTRNMFNVTLPRLGIDVRFTSSDVNPDELDSLIDERTKAVYLESIPNPSLRLVDVGGLAERAHAHGVAVIVDNTAGMGGYLYRPIEHGADVVVTSVTKWINGHGTAVGGAIIDAGTMDWGNGRYPLFTEPSPSYNGLKFWEVFGPEGPFGNVAFAIRARVEGLRDFGAALAPQNAFLHLQGLETLSLRAERAVENTLGLARWLEARPEVASVNHPDLESHPDHARAKAHFPRGAGGVLTFELEGGLDAGRRFLDAVQLCSRLVNLGDAKTSVTHPASTTHSQLSEAQLAAAGITPGTIRIATGLEHIDDLKDDLAQALDVSQRSA
jgi:O-acetylhomoserine (thiol)-lyase